MTQSSGLQLIDARDSDFLWVLGGEPVTPGRVSALLDYILTYQ